MRQAHSIRQCRRQSASDADRNLRYRQTIPCTVRSPAVKSPKTSASAPMHSRPAAKASADRLCNPCRKHRAVWNADCMFQLKHNEIPGGKPEEIKNEGYKSQRSKQNETDEFACRQFDCARSSMRGVCGVYCACRVLRRLGGGAAAQIPGRSLKARAVPKTRQTPAARMSLRSRFRRAQ